MTYIQKFTLGIIFTFFSINMLGCSGGGTTTVSKSPPTIQVSLPSNFDFGTVTEGNIASPQEIIITNLGSERLDISTITLSDTSNFQLDVMSGTSPCTTTAPALFTGESCTIEVSFIPLQFNTLPTDINTTLQLNSNDPTTPNKTLNLAGTSERVSSTLTVTINQVEAAICDFTAYVSVTDQSNFPVEGLSAADFTITEAGFPPVLPTSSTVGVLKEPISIAIVMDNSGSMQDIDITEMNKAATEVVLKLTDVDEAAIIKFDKSVYVVREFTANKILLADAIDSPFDGSGDGTAIYDAIQRAILDTRSQLTERKAIILITDGEDTKSASTLVEIIGDAKAEGIPIFVIALGNFDQNIINTVLEPIAKDTSGELYEADVAQNFSTIIEQQLTEVLFTDQYILTYASGSSGSGTDVNLTIDVSNSGGLTGTDSRLVTSCP